MARPPEPPGYRGRFAPSPTGPLHFGSLIAAVGSFADARAHAGCWLVRMEDLDRARERPGAADLILRTLDAFGLHWDEPVIYQRDRADRYQDALLELRRRGLTYACACTRREIAAAGPTGPEGPIYPGTCRNGLPPERRPRSERLRVDAVAISIEDRIQGLIVQRLAAEVGDFVLRRADGLHAYQLAVVVDDAEQRIDQVVRGADLLASAPRQRLLQRLLDLPEPAYAHLPLALGADGRKLSKSLAARPVDPADPLPALLAAWRFLGQRPLPEPPATVEAFWTQAISTWSVAHIPRSRQQPAMAITDNRPAIG
jgi:glutamyl-Q tRNA(Asp) synthetase